MGQAQALGLGKATASSSTRVSPAAIALPAFIQASPRQVHFGSCLEPENYDPGRAPRAPTPTVFTQTGEGGRDLSPQTPWNQHS